MWHPYMPMSQITLVVTSGSNHKGSTGPAKHFLRTNMAAANFVLITNVSLMEVCQIELIAIFHKSRRHQRVFVTSEYTSSTTTTTTTSRHLLQTHRCTKKRCEFTLLSSHWLGCGGCHLNGREVRD